MDFAKLLEKQAGSYSDKPALIFHDSPITYRDLKETTFKIAAGISKLGITKGDKIAIFLPNIPEYAYSLLSIFTLRGVCVPLDFMLTEEELVNFINHSESKILIAQEKKNVDLVSLKNKCPCLKEIILFEQDITAPKEEKVFKGWRGLLQEEITPLSIEINPKDTAAIFYTSGSTGHPKGVPLNYNQLENPVKTLIYFIKPTDKDSFLCGGVPFSHLGGLDYILFMLYFGTTLVLMERFQPFEFLKNLQQYKITIFCIVPSMYVAILSLKEYEKFDLSALRYAVVFGAPSSPVLLERFHKGCPNAYLLNGWGMTETSAPNTFLPTGTNTKEIPNTGKFPPGTEAKIVDDRGQELNAGEEGELWIRGEGVMIGYFKEPQITAELLTNDGWLKTGDVVKRDAQGRYSIVGRKKEMIKVAGEIVFCPELEEVIQRHPKVKETAVIGVPEKLRGEVPKAFIVVKEGVILTEEELRAFLKQHLAHFKIPHYFEFLASLPKNRVGKIDKETLKKS